MASRWLKLRKLPQSFHKQHRHLQSQYSSPNSFCLDIDIQKVPGACDGKMLQDVTMSRGLILTNRVAAKSKGKSAVEEVREHLEKAEPLPVY